MKECIEYMNNFEMEIMTIEGLINKVDNEKMQELLSHDIDNKKTLLNKYRSVLSNISSDDICCRLFAKILGGTPPTKAVEEVKAGRVEYRTDSFGNVHGIIGKVSFKEEDLLENLNAFVAQILRIKPATVKGEYIKNISISSTMGPGIKVENNFDK